MLRIIIIRSAIIIATASLSSCVSTPGLGPNQETPLYLMSRAESGRYWKKFYANLASDAVAGACVFGTKSVIDRKKLECEKVKDSSEWKEIQEKNNSLREALQEETNNSSISEK